MLSLIRALFNLLIRSVSLVAGVLPTSADTVAAAAVTVTAAAGAWTWGAWTQIAASVGTAPVQITGFTLENPVGAAFQGEIAIGTGTAPAGAERGRWPLVAGHYVLPIPFWVAAGAGVVARLRTSTGAADTIDVKLTTQTGF